MQLRILYAPVSRSWIQDCRPPLAPSVAEGPASRVIREPAKPSAGWLAGPHRFALPLAAAGFGVLAIGLFLLRLDVHRDTSFNSAVVVSVPDSALTPGATVLASRQTVCAEANIKINSFRLHCSARCFRNMALPERSRELTRSTIWLHRRSAGGRYSQPVAALLRGHRLEFRSERRLGGSLRELVCDGSLDLPEAQREIATNWIAAYKKYFQTDRPLAGTSREAFSNGQAPLECASAHRRLVKMRPF